jgi:hypothetical protein
MKTVEDLITELNYSLPYGDNEIRKAYKLGQINLLLELANKVQGYPVNGLIRGIITEDQLTDKLVEVSND